MHALARLIDASMAANGLKQADVARRTGISTSRISGMTNHELKDLPGKETIYSLARGLGVPPWVVMEACLESLGLPTKPGYVTIDDAVAADPTLDMASKRAILAFVTHLRTTASPTPSYSDPEVQSLGTVQTDPALRVVEAAPDRR